MNGDLDIEQRPNADGKLLWYKRKTGQVVKKPRFGCAHRRAAVAKWMEEKETDPTLEEPTRKPLIGWMYDRKEKTMWKVVYGEEAEKLRKMKKAPGYRMTIEQLMERNCNNKSEAAKRRVRSKQGKFIAASDAQGKKVQSNDEESEPEESEPEEQQEWYVSTPKKLRSNQIKTTTVELVVEEPEKEMTKENHLANLNLASV